MFKTVISDRHLWLLVLFSTFVWILGRHTLPVGVALTAVVKIGYWFALASFTLWLICFWGLARKDGWSLPKDVRSWGVVGLILLGGGLWQAHETHGFKILADEALLVGTAQTMHMDRDVGYPVRATDVQGPFQILQSVLDKRPYFFPFLVSLVHDLTGYRATNAFWLNTFLGFIFLGLLYVLGRMAGGRRSAGVLLVLLAIGLPLLAQQAAGAGFELLNVTLILGWWALGMRMMSRPDAESQDLFVMTAVLLASTRYESLLFMAPTALVLLSTWAREGVVRFTWSTWLAPLFLLPLLWLNKAFTANERNWQMESMGAEKPFGLEFLPGNLGHALKYFFTFDGYQPNAPLLGLFGLLAAPVFLLWAQRVVRAGAKADGAELGLALGALGPLGVTAVLMVYFWGQFDHPVITRLSLPTQALMLVAIAVAVGRVWRPRLAVWRGLIAAAVLALVAYSLPVMAKNAYGRDYSPGVAHAWRREFLAQQPSRDFLMIDRDPLMWITERIPATPIAQAALRRDGIAYHLRNRSFRAVYVFQGYKVDPETGALSLEPEDDLGPDFVLEPVTERRVHILHIARISRVVEIRSGETTLARAEPFARVTKSDATAQEVQAARRVYLERWVKELP